MPKGAGPSTTFHHKIEVLRIIHATCIGDQRAISANLPARSLSRPSVGGPAEVLGFVLLGCIRLWIRFVQRVIFYLELRANYAVSGQVNRHATESWKNLKLIRDLSWLVACQCKFCTHGSSMIDVPIPMAA